MDSELSIEKQEFSLIKEKIIKTNELLTLYNEKTVKLGRATQAFKHLKVTYENLLREVEKLKFENAKLNDRLERLQPQHEKTKGELKELKSDYAKVEALYQQHLIESQLITTQLEGKVKQCICEQNIFTTPKKKSLDDKFRELKQMYQNVKKENYSLIEKNKRLEQNKNNSKDKEEIDALKEQLQKAELSLKNQSDLEDTIASLKKHHRDEVDSLKIKVSNLSLDGRKLKDLEEGYFALRQEMHNIESRIIEKCNMSAKTQDFCQQNFVKLHNAVCTEDQEVEKVNDDALTDILKKMIVPLTILSPFSPESKSPDVSSSTPDDIASVRASNESVADNTTRASKRRGDNINVDDLLPEKRKNEGDWNDPQTNTSSVKTITDNVIDAKIPSRKLLNGKIHNLFPSDSEVDERKTFDTESLSENELLNGAADLLPEKRKNEEDWNDLRTNTSSVMTITDKVIDAMIPSRKLLNGNIHNLFPSDSEVDERKTFDTESLSENELLNGAADLLPENRKNEEDWNDLRTNTSSVMTITDKVIDAKIPNRKLLNGKIHNLFSSDSKVNERKTVDKESLGENKSKNELLIGAADLLPENRKNEEDWNDLRTNTSSVMTITDKVIDAKIPNRKLLNGKIHNLFSSDSKVNERKTVDKESLGENKSKNELLIGAVDLLPENRKNEEDWNDLRTNTSGVKTITDNVIETEAKIRSKKLSNRKIRNLFPSDSEVDEMETFDKETLGENKSENELLNEAADLPPEKRNNEGVRNDLRTNTSSVRTITDKVIEAKITNKKLLNRKIRNLFSLDSEVDEGKTFDKESLGENKSENELLNGAADLLPENRKNGGDRNDLRPDTSAVKTITDNVIEAEAKIRSKKLSNRKIFNLFPSDSELNEMETFDKESLGENKSENDLLNGAADLLPEKRKNEKDWNDLRTNTSAVKRIADNVIETKIRTKKLRSRKIRNLFPSDSEVDESKTFDKESLGENKSKNELLIGAVDLLPENRKNEEDWNDLRTNTSGVKTITDNVIETEAKIRSKKLSNRKIRNLFPSDSEVDEMETFDKETLGENKSENELLNEAADLPPEKRNNEGVRNDLRTNTSSVRTITDKVIEAKITNKKLLNRKIRNLFSLDSEVDEGKTFDKESLGENKSENELLNGAADLLPENRKNGGDRNDLRPDTSAVKTITDNVIEAEAKIRSKKLSNRKIFNLFPSDSELNEMETFDKESLGENKSENDLLNGAADLLPEKRKNEKDWNDLRTNTSAVKRIADNVIETKIRTKKLRSRKIRNLFPSDSEVDESKTFDKESLGENKSENELLNGAADLLPEKRKNKEDWNDLRTNTSAVKTITDNVIEAEPEIRSKKVSNRKIHNLFPSDSEVDETETFDKETLGESKSENELLNEAADLLPEKRNNEGDWNGLRTNTSSVRTITDNVIEAKITNKKLSNRKIRHLFPSGSEVDKTKTFDESLGENKSEYELLNGAADLLPEKRKNEGDWNGLRTNTSAVRAITENVIGAQIPNKKLRHRKIRNLFSSDSEVDETETFNKESLATNKSENEKEAPQTPSDHTVLEFAVNVSPNATDILSANTNVELNECTKVNFETKSEINTKNYSAFILSAVLEDTNQELNDLQTTTSDILEMLRRPIKYPVTNSVLKDDEVPKASVSQQDIFGDSEDTNPPQSKPATDAVCSRITSDRNNIINIVQDDHIAKGQPFNLMPARYSVRRSPRKRLARVSSPTTTPIDILSQVMEEMTKMANSLSACDKKSTVVPHFKERPVRNLTRSRAVKEAQAREEKDVLDDPYLDCPRSPDVVEVPDRLPRLIPTEKPEVLRRPKVRLLIDKLVMFCSEEMIVNEVIREFAFQDTKYMVEIILEKVSGDIYDKADNAYPPSPPMTITQRVMLGFLIKLDRWTHPGILDKFLEAAELALYRRTSCQLHTVQPITRLYTAICKTTRDLDRIRRFIGDCFYFVGDFAVPILFTVLTMWPEVLPMESEVSKYPLAKVIVQLCYLKLCNEPGYNLLPLRDLLHKYYGYPTDRWSCDEVFEEILIEYIRNPSIRLSDYTLLLFLKNKPAKWVYDKVKGNLMPLYQFVPESNPNLKATLLITLTNIFKTFTPNDEAERSWLSEMFQWFEQLAKVEREPMVQRSLRLARKRLPKIRKIKKKGKNRGVQKTPVKTENNISENSKLCSIDRIEGTTEIAMVGLETSVINNASDCIINVNVTRHKIEAENSLVEVRNANTSQANNSFCLSNASQ